MDPRLLLFREKFMVAELLIHRSNHWTWSVRPTHSTFGSGLLSLNRYCEHLSELTPDESKDLGAICQIIERALNRVSTPDRFNYLMLMMVDPHLHFHVLPRYERSIDFGGRIWTDSGWPALPSLAENADTELETLFGIRDALRAARETTSVDQG